MSQFLKGAIIGVALMPAPGIADVASGPWYRLEVDLSDQLASGSQGSISFYFGPDGQVRDAEVHTEDRQESVQASRKCIVVSRNPYTCWPLIPVGGGNGGTAAEVEPVFVQIVPEFDGNADGAVGFSIRAFEVPSEGTQIDVIIEKEVSVDAIQKH